MSIWPNCSWSVGMGLPTKLAWRLRGSLIGGGGGRSLLRDEAPDIVTVESPSTSVQRLHRRVKEIVPATVRTVVKGLLPSKLSRSTPQLIPYRTFGWQKLLQPGW